MQIVIVGGGAGGLELATTLGKKLGRRNRADITLIDRNHTHIWKPLLHEVASGSLDGELDAVTYRVQGHHCGFDFELGTLCGVNRANKTIKLAALHDEEGREILPARERSYDILVLAIGSVSNDFNVSGVASHCIFLDSVDQAARFHRRLVNGFIKLNQVIANGNREQQINIAIVGGGATGVELAAELYKAREWFATYGLKEISPQHLSVSIVEAGPRILPALNEQIASGAHRELETLGVHVQLNTTVNSADDEGLHTKDGQYIPADIAVWTAGIKAPDFLREIEGLQCNRAGQLIVKPTLQVRGDKDIFALGDCAGFSLNSAEGRVSWVPPRAQSAHQMAATTGKNIIAKIDGKPLREFIYRDRGSLVSLSDYSSFGRLMSGLGGSGINLEGKMARWAYVSLYRMHQVALYGWWRTGILALGDRFNHFVRPRFKLH
ncbi:MAG: NAD(P)/FAD-dependent oxidoreductase [Parahaliea sp.]